MKNLTDIKNEVAFEKENCKWNCLFMVDQWNYSDEVAKRYATEAIKADREKVAENVKMVYHCGHTKKNYPTVHHQSGADNIQIDKESILNLPIELK